MTDVPKFVCPAEHKHDVNSTCYVQHRCRCTPCRAARSSAQRGRNRAQAYGRYDSGLVDAAPVREHIQYLQANGMGWKHIGTVSGVGFTGIATLIYGRKGGPDDPRKGEVLKRTSRVKAEKILAVRPELRLLSAGALVPARGTHRRIQALVARGWSQSKLSIRVGILPSNFISMMRRTDVTAGLALKVIALYDELWNVAPPQAGWRDKIAYSRSISYAAARRWVPPFGWDDIDVDREPPVPDAVEGVDVVCIAAAVAGEHVRLSSAELRVAVSELWASRWSDARIAAQLDVAARTVHRIRAELDLPAFDQTKLIHRSAA